MISAPQNTVPRGHVNVHPSVVNSRGLGRLVPGRTRFPNDGDREKSKNPFRFRQVIEETEISYTAALCLAIRKAEENAQRRHSECNAFADTTRTVFSKTVYECTRHDISPKSGRSKENFTRVNSIVVAANIS